MKGTILVVLAAGILPAGCASRGEGGEAGGPEPVAAARIPSGGFVTREADGRLWVFRSGAKELAEFAESGELAKMVTRIGAGPGGATLRAPDAETLDAWAATR